MRFLSNWKEAANLNSGEYQDRLAWTIHVGIMEFLESEEILLIFAENCTIVKAR